jgi:hypothetical protein
MKEGPKAVYTSEHTNAILLPMLCVLLALTLGCSKKQSEQPAPTTSASTDVAGPWRMQLSISTERPSMAKPIRLTLHIADERGQQVNDAQVNGALTMKLMDMGVTQLKFAPKGNGDYEVSTNIDMSGPWSLTVDVAQARVHVKKSFDVTVYD